MIIRNDLRNSVIIPKELQEHCRKVGGTNPYGENLFRLIWAQDRVVKAAGEWNIWPEEASVDERGGLGIQTMQMMLKQMHDVLSAMQIAGIPREDIRKHEQQMQAELDAQWQSRMSVRPTRVDRGMEDVNLYALEGYILEKWKPAEAFGSREEWEAYRFEGLNALGPYPVLGDYEMIAGPTPYLPTAGQLEDAIRQHMRELNSRPASPRERVLLMLNRAEEKRRQRAKQRRDEIDAQIKDGPASLANRLSLGAGRVIQDLADKAGLKGHYGA